MLLLTRNEIKEPASLLPLLRNELRLAEPREGGSHQHHTLTLTRVWEAWIRCQIRADAVYRKITDGSRTTKKVKRIHFLDL